MGWERRKTWDREKTKGFPGDAQRRGMEAGRRAENQHSRTVSNAVWLMLR